MIDTPYITRSPAQQLAVIHITVPRAEMKTVMGPGLQELMQTIKAQGIPATGPWFTHHLKMDPSTFDFEICVPVASEVKPAGRVKPGQLPAAIVARTLYHGPYEGLSHAWQQFEKWMVDNGKTSAPDLWEIYLAGPESSPDPANWRTELNRPLAH